MQQKKCSHWNKVEILVEYCLIKMQKNRDPILQIKVSGLNAYLYYVKDENRDRWSVFTVLSHHFVWIMG